MKAAEQLLAADPLLVEGLHALGIGRGAVLYLAADLMRVVDWTAVRECGQADVRELLPAWAYLSIRQVIGSDGTVVVPTFTYEYARRHTPFIHEESPSETGAFSEYVRQLPSSIRSMHPLFSLTANGPRASAICDDVGRSAYGARSAFGRLLGENVVFVFLGTRLADTLSYVHHLEHLYGVNYYMHKAFDTPAYRGRELVPGPWLAFVRYLGCGIELTGQRFEQHLRSMGLVRDYREAERFISAASCSGVHEQGLKCLDADPWIFIERPVYIRFQQENLKIFDTSVPSALVGWMP